SKSGDIKKVAQVYGFTREDDLIAQVGFGKITPRQILHRAVPELEQDPPQEKPFFKKIIEGKRRKKDTDGVVVKGLDDILVKFSKCCNPLPGDPIIGFITQGEGVKVHRKNCINTHKMNPERQIEVEWSRETTETYPASIKVTCDDRSGLLADLAYVISKNNSNIRNVHSDTTDTGTSRFYFTISVESSDQLHRIMSHLKKVKKVKNVKRIVGNRDGEPED
ncbi:MAG: ACT domain-containing protein, partial [Desulfobacteraceae bacterium]